MRFSNNNFLIFFNERESASQVTEIIRKKYPEKNNNLIKSVHEFSDASIILKEHWEEKIFFDIIILDLRIPLKIRKEFIKTATGKQAVPDWILVSNNIGLKNDDKIFIDKFKMSLLADINELTLFSLLENIFDKRFNEKKYNLINRIDDIVNLKIDSKQMLDEIVKNTLGYLNLKICWISNVDYKEKKVKSGALTGVEEFGEEFRKVFDISLSDESVTVECINKKKQIQYKNIFAKNCPFKDKKIAKKIGLKSVLLTPVLERCYKKQRKVIATLNLYTDFFHEFQEDECELAQIIASKTARILSMKDVYEEERDETRKKLVLIEKVAAEINKNVSDHKKVFETIVKKGIELVRADRGCIKLCHKSYISCECHVNCNNAICDRVEYGKPDITNYVIKHKKSLIILDVDSFSYKSPEIDYKDVSSRISVPLMLDDEVIGILTAEHRAKNYFTKHHLQLFEALARHAVIAIENTKRDKQLQKRLKSQMVIKELIKEISELAAIEDQKRRNKYRITQLDKIIELVIKETGKIFDAYSGFVVLAGFKSKYVIRKEEWQNVPKNYALPNLEIGVKQSGRIVFEVKSCIVGKVIADGKLYNCPNVMEDKFYLSYGEDDKTRSEIVIPLKFQEQTFGAFVLDSIYENGFSVEDAGILESIATQMALLIKRFSYLNTLIDLNKPFKNIDDLKQLYIEIVNKTLEILETKVSYLRILDRNELIVKGCIGIDKYVFLPMQVGEGISGKVAQTLEPIIISNIQEPLSEYKYKNFAKEYKLFAMISVPIVSTEVDGKRDLIGVLTTYASRICSFTSLDLQLMLGIAEKAGEAIKKARLIKQLDDIARVDKEFTTSTEKEILKSIADDAKNLLDADQVVLYQYNSNIPFNFGFSTRITVSGDSKADDHKFPTNFTKDSFVVQLLEEKSNEFFLEAFETSDLIKSLYKNRANDDRYQRFYQREQLQSTIILKLTFKGETVGILFINYRYKKYFSAEVKRIARTFANKTAIAISNIRKYEDVERVHDIGNTIVSEMNIKNVLESITVNSYVALKADIVILYRYDSNTKKLLPKPIPEGNIYYPGEIVGKYTKDNVQLKVIDKGRDIFSSDVKKNIIFGSGEILKTDNGTKRRFVDREEIKSCAAILLKVRNKIVGLMFINYRNKQKFDENQKKIIKIFANQAAIAIRNANLIEESKETINRISTNIDAIQKSGYSIVKNLNKEQVSERDILKPILDKALKLIDVDMGYIGISNKEYRNTKIVVCSKKYRKLTNTSIKHYYPDAEWIKRHEKFDIYLDKEQKGDYKRFADNPQFLSGIQEEVFTEDKDVKSALRVPIYSAKEFLGMIVLESEKENTFSEIDAYAVMSLANQASMALQNYKLLGQLKRVRELSLEILREQSLDNVLKRILESTLELVRKKYADIKLLMGNSNLIIKKSNPEGAEGKMIDINQCLSGISIKSKKTHYEKDVSKNMKFLETEGFNIKSELVIPLIVDKEPIGVLNVESELLDDFTEEDIKILEMLSSQVAIAIFLAQQKDKLVEKEKEANLGYITRESVHWVGNKIGPISRRVENITDGLMELHNKGTLSDENLKPFLKDLSIIKKGTDSALSIKSDLIDTSKQKNKFSLIKILKDTIGNFNNEYSSIEIKNLSGVNSFPYTISSDFGKKSFQFYGDKDHIGRVFHYILKNAFQAIEDMVLTIHDAHKDNLSFSGRISVRAHKERNHLVIEFEDNGIGITQEDEAKLFRPFHTTKGADRGSGVGLYFCKRTMEEMGGKIYLKETEYGKGATFCLEFPKIKNITNFQKGRIDEHYR